VGDSRPTVNPLIRKLFAYGQMLFGAAAGVCIAVGAVWTFLSHYATDIEVEAKIKKHSVDLVEKGEPLPHDARFSNLEAQVTKLLITQARDEELISALKATSTDTLKILVRRIVVDTEPKAALRMHKGAVAEDIFEYWVEKGEKPIDALRKAVRACGRGRKCISR